MSFAKIKEVCLDFLKQPPGKRFVMSHEKMYKYTQVHFLVKCLCVLTVPLLGLIGIILLFIPGPGLLFIVLSLLVLSMLSRRTAVCFDKIEIHIHRYIERIKNAKKP